MSESHIRPTAPSHTGSVPRFGMYAGPNYAGGHALRGGELPDASIWQVPPVGHLDDITRNHDINYTYIEQTYRGTDAASREARTQAFWQADKEMLGAMLHHQPGNWLEAQYRSAAVQAFVAKTDLNYRPTVDVVGDWNRELAGIDPKFPALRVHPDGRANWSLPGLLHAGSTYTSTGMEALSTSGVNSQVAVLFNQHIQPGQIGPQHVNSGGDSYDPLAVRDFSRRLMIPQRDPQNPNVFTAEGIIKGKEVIVEYNEKKNRLVHTISSNGQIKSQTIYQGVKADGPAGDKYDHADFTVTQQKYKNGQPDGEPVTLPPVKAAATPDIEQQQSAHTTEIKKEVLKGKEAHYPNAPTEADQAWHTGKEAKPAQFTPKPSSAVPEPTISETERGTTGRTAPALSPGAERLLHDSERHVRALADKHSLPWDPGMDNTVAAIARHAQADGLHRIDHLAVKDGQIRYASFDGVVMKEGSTPAHGAANAPAEQSLAELSRTNETAARVHEGSIQQLVPPTREALVRA